MSLHHQHHLGSPVASRLSPPFATSTPRNQPQPPTSLAAPLHYGAMVRLTASPINQFLMHQARFAAAAASAASPLMANSSFASPGPGSGSGSSIEDKSLSSSSGSNNSSNNNNNNGSSDSSAGDTPMSRTNQYKKIMKPLLERKRRARINKCLDELKDIMTVALQAQGENVSKLEKADILELTVKHLHKLQQTQRLMPRNPMEEIHRFQAGYTSCAQEAASFLLQAPGVDVTISQRLLNHLTSSSTLAATVSSASNNPFLHDPVRLPRGSGFHSPPSASPSSTRLSPPPRPSSNPETSSQTMGSFRLSIRKASESNEAEDLKMPIKPSPIRLNPNDPVWRPF